MHEQTAHKPFPVILTSLMKNQPTMIGIKTTEFSTMFSILQNQTTPAQERRDVNCCFKCVGVEIENKCSKMVC